MTNQDLKPRNLKTAITRMEAAERLLVQCMQTIHDLSTWTPCSERMPDSDRCVLVCTVVSLGRLYRGIQIACWIEGEGWGSTHGGGKCIYTHTTITHWRDLPELPEEATHA